MINKTFLLRLVLDFTAAGLLLMALAYYWLDNTAHELIGTGVFLLVIVHKVFTRRWYGTITKPPHAPRKLIDVVLTLSLLATLLALLLTSVMISRTVFAFLQINGGFSVRQVHMLAAYWGVILVAVHLGLRWQRVMNAVRNAMRVTGRSTARTLVLRGCAAALAAHGLYSSFVMGIGTKLSAQMSLDGWDFATSAPGFFMHWLSIVGLYAFVAYYLPAWVGRLNVTRGLSVQRQLPERTSRGSPARALHSRQHALRIFRSQQPPGRRPPVHFPEKETP